MQNSILKNNMNIDESYKFCENLSREHYENFPVGSLLIPKKKRKYVYSLYAFARTADDIADSGELSPDEKIKELDIFENELKECYEGVFKNKKETNKKIFTALSHTKDELDIPIKEFQNLLKAFKQDAVKDRYRTFQELLEYSEYSANPIGHLVLYVFGYNEKKDKKIFHLSDKICTALQLTNFWQDVSKDLEINRIYIPKELMTKFDYKEKQLFEKTESGEFRMMMKELVNKTKELFLEGKEIVDYVKGRLKLELIATYLGGNEILKKIEEMNYNVLSKHAKIDTGNKINILFKTILNRLN